MKNHLPIGLLLLVSTNIFAQQSDMQMKMAQAKPVALLPGLGSWGRPTSTKNPEALSNF